MAAPPSIHCLVFDGFADWEPSYALAELRRSGRRRVRTVGGSAPVESMGGLRVVPEAEVAAVRPEEVELLILPGGDVWEQALPYPELAELLPRLERHGVPVAAICGATVALARLGLLAGRRHTGNGREWLAQAAPEYPGRELYQEELAVRDRGIITASGLGPVEFAREIFAELEVFPGELEVWYRAFKFGEFPGS